MAGLAPKYLAFAEGEIWRLRHLYYDILIVGCAVQNHSLPTKKAYSF